MSIAVPWGLLMIMEAWRYGIKAPTGPQWPEPYRFIMGSVAMGFAAIIAQFNPRIGGLLAWGLFLGAALQQARPAPVPTQQAAPTRTIANLPGSDTSPFAQQPTYQV